MKLTSTQMNSPAVNLAPKQVSIACGRSVIGQLLWFLLSLHLITKTDVHILNARRKNGRGTHIIRCVIDFDGEVFLLSGTNATQS